MATFVCSRARLWWVLSLLVWQPCPSCSLRFLDTLFSGAMLMQPYFEDPAPFRLPFGSSLAGWRRMRWRVQQACLRVCVAAEANSSCRSAGERINNGSAVGAQSLTCCSRPCPHRYILKWNLTLSELYKLKTLFRLYAHYTLLNTFSPKHLCL